MKTGSIKGNTLKIIAVVTMIIDHIGASILQQIMAEKGTLGIAALGIQTIMQLDGTDRTLAICWWVMRMVIGRIAFPIYCFLLAEGFLHTKSVLKYGARLFLFALLSEVPFDLAIWKTWYEPKYQNVFFTLFLGLMGMWGIATLNQIRVKKSQKGKIVDGIKNAGCFFGILLVAGCCLGAAEFLRTDYGAGGVAFILLLYLFNNVRSVQLAAGCVGSILILEELTAPLAFIPIAFYKGERGGKGKSKLFFYAVYPIHLLILYGVCRCLGPA